MRRAEFENKMDKFDDRSVYGKVGLLVVRDRAVRDFIWTQIMGRAPTQWANCDECGVSFPKSTKNQRFHSPVCKNRAAQRKRREREDSA